MKISALVEITKHEFNLELKNKFSMAGLLLYNLSSVYVLNLAVHSLSGMKFMALFWILQLFSASTSAAKSFIPESRGRNFYYYQLSSPNNFLFGKIIYNTALMLSLSLITLFTFHILFTIPEGVNISLFILIIFLGAVSFSTCMTMISAISIKSGGGPVLMAILGFPIILPQLLVILRLSKTALDGFGFDLAANNLFGLLALNIIVGATAYVLFPYLWRD